MRQSAIHTERDFMIKATLLAGCLLLCITGMLNASSEAWLNGTVTDENDEPIEGVEVKFSNSSAKTITDANGKYEFDSTVDVISIKSEFLSERPSLNGNFLLFTVSKDGTPVRVGIFTMNGRSVRIVHNGILPAAQHHIRLSDHLAPATYIVQLEINGKVFSERFVVDGNRATGTGSSFSAVTVDKNAGKRASSYIDQLICEKGGYVSKYTNLTSYKGTVDVQLAVEDTIPPVLTFDPGTDTVQIQYSDTNGIHWWMQFENFCLTVTDNKDTEFHLTAPTNTLINYSKPGFEEFVYRARDSDWNIGEARRLIVLYDSTVTDDTDPPVFNWDEDTVHLALGTIFDPLEGVTITDEVDTMVNFIPWVDVNDDIESSFERMADGIICDVPGTYTINYRSIDTSLNEAKASRTVVVAEAE
jgi:hypothetical protein